MVHDDFDIDALAVYLHLTPAQVLRLASREKIPGRRIGGEWRFSPAEIHHWLEERIGVSDGDELLRMESVLEENATKSGDQPVSMELLMSPEAILLPVQARTRRSLIRSICDHTANAGLLWDPDKMEEAIHVRESLHPTALENGVALLHPRRPLAGALGEPFVALGISAGGLHFGGPRGRLTDLFFLVGSVDDRDHLRTLARLSRLISINELLEEIRNASSAAAVYEIMIQADQALT